MSGKRARQFRTVKRPRLPRNKFDLSHERRFTADMFWLIPCLLDDCIPGDKWNIGNELVIRMNPLVAPILHEINAYIHYYFVPYRLLWEDFEKFITGGEDGTFTADIPEFPFNSVLCDDNSLWDYFGFNTALGQSFYCIKYPNAFPLYAYNLIWNEYYRDQNVISKVDITEYQNTDFDIGIVQVRYNGCRLRAWNKDYFTSMLPWQQRGQAPAIPIDLIDITAFADFSDMSDIVSADTGYNYDVPLYGVNNPDYGSGALRLKAGNEEEFPKIPETLELTNQRLKEKLSDNRIHLEEQKIRTIDVSELRLMFQVQKFLERSSRVGSRYTEFIKGHYVAYPRDERLNRPEYIGGSKTPIIISEVLNTTGDTVNADRNINQGNMAGHGLSVDRNYVASYTVQEHGLIMGIMSIMPKTLYSQGIDRVWLKESRYDFYFPEFANLSEQAVFTEELYNFEPAPVDKVLGYQGHWDQYRFKRNTVHGDFKTVFEYWHLGRKFANAPALNQDFLYPNRDERYYMKRSLAVPAEPMFLISLGNKCHVTRSMPYMAEPGLIDHN